MKFWVVLQTSVLRTQPKPKSRSLRLRPRKTCLQQASRDLGVGMTGLGVPLKP
jgi:hypothetical protein